MSRRHTLGPEFNAKPLLAELNVVRRGSAKPAGQKRPLSWRMIAHQAGISPSTFTRLNEGRAPDAVTLGRILVWLGRPPTWMK